MLQGGPLELGAFVPRPWPSRLTRLSVFGRLDCATELDLGAGPHRIGGELNMDPI